MKLYRVYTKSLSAYVVAKNSLEAEKEFTDWLDIEDYGYSCERVVVKTELLADTGSKPNPSIYPTEMLIGAIKDEE